MKLLFHRGNHLLLYTFNRESKTDSTFIQDNNVIKYIIHFTTRRE